MRISDWSSDVCSSDLLAKPRSEGGRAIPACREISAVVDRRKASAIGSVIVQDKRRNTPAAEGGAIPPPVATSLNRVARTWPARSGRASSISYSHAAIRPARAAGRERGGRDVE